jgi:hypothetical protein
MRAKKMKKVKKMGKLNQAGISGALPIVIVVIVIAAAATGAIYFATRPATGTFVLQVTDQPDAIGDFENLAIKVSKVMIHSASENTWLEFQPSQESFDLVQLQGDNVATLVSTTLKEDNYTQVRLVVVEAIGTLKERGTENVIVPSDELKLVKSFEIVSGKTTTLVLDIHVVKAGTEYVLTPVTGKVCME